MQGTFVNDERPRTKKALREAIMHFPEKVRLEATSLFGGEYDGPLAFAPPGTYYVVGPDPYTSRKWYGQIKVDSKGAVLS